MAKAACDPYQVVMRRSGLPVTLLNEKAKHARVHILDTQPFEDTFGKKASRLDIFFNFATLTKI